MIRLEDFNNEQSPEYQITPEEIKKKEEMNNLAVALINQWVENFEGENPQVLFADRILKILKERGVDHESLESYHIAIGSTPMNPKSFDTEDGVVFREFKNFAEETLVEGLAS